MRKLTLILVTLLLAVSFMTAQETREKATIVVIPFDTEDIEANDAEVLFDTFTNKIVDSRKFKVVDRSKVNEIKKQHEFQNSDWSNDDKVAKLGSALNANMVVVGKIHSFQNQTKAFFRILDVNTMEIVSNAESLFSDVLDLYNKIPEVVKKLMGEIDSISTSSTSGIVYNNEVNGKIYNIGDNGPGGGVIFYYSEAGFNVYEPDGSVRKCHYFEVSKFDLGDIKWSIKSNILTLTSLGSGKINTFKIIKSYPNTGTLTKENCAAFACHSYSTATTKVGDWFLPSIDELSLLYKNLRERVLLSNTTNDTVYWSSSQHNYSNAKCHVFSDDGYQTYEEKTGSTNSVRAIRAF